MNIPDWRIVPQPLPSLIMLHALLNFYSAGGTYALPPKFHFTGNPFSWKKSLHVCIYFQNFVWNQVREFIYPTSSVERITMYSVLGIYGNGVSNTMISGNTGELLKWYLEYKVLGGERERTFFHIEIHTLFHLSFIRNIPYVWMLNAIYLSYIEQNFQVKLIRW